MPQPKPSTEDAHQTRRSAAIVVREGISSFDAELNEFEFVLATETPALAYRANQLVDEVLSMAGLANFSEAPNWPLLRDHDWNTESVVGRVISARIEGDQLICRARLSRRKDVEDIALDIRDGILADFSVGLSFTPNLETTVHRDGDRPLVTVNEWAVEEASIVAVPADKNAKSRSRKKASQRSADPAPSEASTEQLAAVDAALTAFADAEQALEAAQTTLNDARAAAGLEAEDEPDAGADEGDDKDKPEVDAARAAQIAAFRSIVVKRSHATGEEFDTLVASGASDAELRSVVLASMTSRSRDVDSTPPATTEAPASTGLRSIRANIAARAAAKN